MASRVLLVDDREDDLDTMVRAAERAGFPDSDIEKARDEAEANSLIERETFQLAVVDIALTGTSDLEEGLRVIRKLADEQPRCRIIAATFTLGIKVGVRALREGASDFVSKTMTGYSWEDLLAQRLALWKGVIEEPSSSAFTRI